MTSKKNIVVSWVGTTDLNIMNQWRFNNGLELSPVTKDKNAKSGVIKQEHFKVTDFVESEGLNGPIRTFLDARKNQIEKIYILLTEEYKNEGEYICDWIKRGNDAECIPVKTGVCDPTNYDEVNKALLSFFNKYWKIQDATRYLYNVTPGTPATQAMLVYYSSSRGGRLFSVINPKFVVDGKRENEIHLPLSFQPYDEHFDYSHTLSDGNELNIAKKYYAKPKFVNILILGESGVGKSRAARQLHDVYSKTTITTKNATKTVKGEFVSVNCAELAAGDGSMFRTELFGYFKGAYTGAADKNTEGKLDKAQNGTIFFDEIAEIPYEKQAILLRLLQDREYERVGNGKDEPNFKRKVKADNIKFIFATNHNLMQDVKEHKFREDLYYRIAMFKIELLPLRVIIQKIKDDPKMGEFLDNSIKEILDGIKEKDPKFKYIRWSLTDEAKELVLRYKWPGNMRELEHILELTCVYTFYNFDEQRQAELTADTYSENTEYKVELTDYALKMNMNQDDLDITDRFVEDVGIPENFEEIIDKIKHGIVNNAVKLFGSYKKAADHLGISRDKVNGILGPVNKK